MSDFQDKTHSPEWAAELDRLNVDREPERLPKWPASPPPVPPATIPAAPGDYFADLAELQAWEHGGRRIGKTYFKRIRPQSLGPHITASARDLLEVIARYNARGRMVLSHGMLSNLIGKHEDTIRRATNQLQAVGYLDKRQQPGRGARSRPNFYRVTRQGWTYLNAMPAAKAAGLVFSGDRPAKIREPYQEESIPCKTDDASEAHASHTDAPSAPIGAARQSQPETAAAHQSQNEHRRKGGVSDASPGVSRPRMANQSGANKRQPAKSDQLAALVAAKLSAARPEPGREYDPFTEIDRVRRQRLSKFDGGAWSRAIAAHGRDTALLAAALAMMKRHDARGDEIKSPASYLGSILRKPPGSLDLTSSLTAILTN